MTPEFAVVVVDDHPLFRDGVVHTLMSNSIDVVGQGASADDALRLTLAHEPDVVLMDLNIPGGGLAALTAITASGIKSHVLPLTIVDDDMSAAGALRSGARGYLLKGIGGRELVEAVRTVARGDLYIAPQLLSRLLGPRAHAPANLNAHGASLSGREEQVLALLSCGLSNKEIAFRLELSEKTVKYYLTHLLRKLHMRNRVEAALYASHRNGSSAALER